MLCWLVNRSGDDFVGVSFGGFAWRLYRSWQHISFINFLSADAWLQKYDHIIFVLLKDLLTYWNLISRWQTSSLSVSCGGEGNVSLLTILITKCSNVPGLGFCTRHRKGLLHTSTNVLNVYTISVTIFQHHYLCPLPFNCLSACRSLIQ